MLGLTIDAPRRQIRFVHSVLPEFLQRLWVHNLRIGESSVDFALERFPNDVGLELLRRQGDVEIMMQK
jgi:hypothetical protein